MEQIMYDEQTNISNIRDPNTRAWELHGNSKKE